MGLYKDIEERKVVSPFFSRFQQMGANCLGGGDISSRTDNVEITRRYVGPLAALLPYALVVSCLEMS